MASLPGLSQLIFPAKGLALEEELINLILDLSLFLSPLLDFLPSPALRLLRKSRWGLDTVSYLHIL